MLTFVTRARFTDDPYKPHPGYDRFIDGKLANLESDLGPAKPLMPTVHAKKSDMVELEIEFVDAEDPIIVELTRKLTEKMFPEPKFTSECYIMEFDWEYGHEKVELENITHCNEYVDLLEAKYKNFRFFNYKITHVKKIEEIIETDKFKRRHH